MIRYAIRQAFAFFSQSDSKFPIKVIFANGKTYQNLPGEAQITVVFKKRRAEWRTLIFNYVGFMESYGDSQIDIEGHDGLRKLMRMSYEVQAKRKKKQSRTFNPIIKWRDMLLEHRNNNRHYLQEKKNLYHHYNMPAEFFHLMNGELYGYTEGYYETGKETQDEAQFKKYDYMCRKLMLKEGDDVIEVGSAWGTLAMLMAKKYGAQVVNYGLVEEQNRIMHQRVKDMGLEDKVKIVVRDHRELKNELERYDKYVSLGVFEHAGKDCQEDWIESIAACLKPGGIGVITFTGRMQSDFLDYLVAKYVWFGCYLPSLADTLKTMERNDLSVVDIECVRFQYANTMEVMLGKMLEQWPKIQAIDPTLFTEKFRRMWMVYYLGAIEAFHAERQNLQAYQLVFVKGRKDIYPNSRSFLYDKPYDLNEMQEYMIPYSDQGPFSAKMAPSSILFDPASKTRVHGS